MNKRAKLSLTRMKRPSLSKIAKEKLEWANIAFNIWCGPEALSGVSFRQTRQSGLTAVMGMDVSFGIFRAAPVASREPLYPISIQVYKNSGLSLFVQSSRIAIESPVVTQGTYRF